MNREAFHLLLMFSLFTSFPDNWLIIAYFCAAQYEELNLHLQRQHQGDSITGLLLIYPSCMLHVVEECLGQIYLLKIFLYDRNVNSERIEFIIWDLSLYSLLVIQWCSAFTATEPERQAARGRLVNLLSCVHHIGHFAFMSLSWGVGGSMTLHLK